MSNAKTLVVVSHYAPRPKDPLTKLTEKLKFITKDIVVVINDDSITGLTLDTLCAPMYVLRRPNLGMNIGGWDAAYKRFPDYDFYIFMQDECRVLRNDFIGAYTAELSRDVVGMTGESINPKWDTAWENIVQSQLNYNLGFDVNGYPVHRVKYYLNCMRKWGIAPGQTGRHLRSLVWAFNQRALGLIKGFPIGLNKEECVASEIAVSKAIEHHGLMVTQVANKPFEYIHHVEWRFDGLGKV